MNTTLGIEHMFSLEGGVDVVMHPGDLSYATGYESEWDRFMEAIEPIAARAPYMTGQGNVRVQTHCCSLNERVVCMVFVPLFLVCLFSFR